MLQGLQVQALATGTTTCYVTWVYCVIYPVISVPPHPCSTSGDNGGSSKTRSQGVRELDVCGCLALGLVCRRA